MLAEGKQEMTAEEKVTKIPNDKWLESKWENSAWRKQAIPNQSPSEGLHLQFLGMILCVAGGRLSNSRNPEKGSVTTSQGPFWLMGGGEELGQVAASLIQAWMFTLP